MKWNDLFFAFGHPMTYTIFRDLAQHDEAIWTEPD
jgi:hypothetical protein